MLKSKPISIHEQDPEDILASLTASINLLLYKQFGLKGRFCLTKSPLKTIIIKAVNQKGFHVLSMYLDIASDYQELFSTKEERDDILRIHSLVRMINERNILVQIIQTETMETIVKPVINPDGIQIQLAPNVTSRFRLFPGINQTEEIERNLKIINMKVDLDTTNYQKDDIVCYISIDLFYDMINWFMHKEQIDISNYELIIPIVKRLELKTIDIIEQLDDFDIFINPSTGLSNKDFLKTWPSELLRNVPVNSGRIRFTILENNFLIVDGIDIESYRPGYILKEYVPDDKIRTTYWALLKVEKFPFVHPNNWQRIHDVLKGKHIIIQKERPEFNIMVGGWHRPEILFQSINIATNYRDSAILSASGPWIIRGERITRNKMIKAVQDLAYLLNKGLESQVEIVSFEHDIISPIEINNVKAFRLLFGEAPKIDFETSAEMIEQKINHIKNEIDNILKHIGIEEKISSQQSYQSIKKDSCDFRHLKTFATLQLIKSEVERIQSWTIQFHFSKIETIQNLIEHINNLFEKSEFITEEIGGKKITKSRKIQEYAIHVLSELHDICEEIIRLDFYLYLKRWPEDISRYRLPVSTIARTNPEMQKDFSEYWTEYQKRLSEMEKEGDTGFYYEQYLWTEFIKRYCDIAAAEFPYYYDLNLNEIGISYYLFNRLLIGHVENKLMKIRNKYRHDSLSYSDIDEPLENETSPYCTLKQLNEQTYDINDLLSVIKDMSRLQLRLIRDQHIDMVNNSLKILKETIQIPRVSEKKGGV